MALFDELSKRVDPVRLADTAMELLRIPSPTGETAEATAAFGLAMEEAGCDVVTHLDEPNAPTLAARLGSAEGPALQFDGHIDVIAVPHAPAALKDGVLYGRGSADMKGSLAACIEVARVVSERIGEFSGRLLFTTHGRHEAPLGHGEGVSALIRRGEFGGAAVVAEGPSDFLAVAGRGMAIYTITAARHGAVTHENETAANTPNPLAAIGELLCQLEEYAKQVGTIERPRVGCETVFVGQVHGGDFYNRFPLRATIEGTRRYVADRSIDDVREEMTEICDRVAKSTGCAVELGLDKIRDGYAVDEDERIVAALREGHLAETGEELPFGGFSSVADASLYVQEAGIPAIYYGCAGYNIHGDDEHVPVENLVRQAKVFLGTICAFFGVGTN